MRARGLILIGLSLILGLAVLFVVQRNQATPVPPPTPVATGPSIVVAAASMKFGDHLTPASLRLVAWPQDAVPDGAFRSVDDLTGKGQDRVALDSIAVGEPILKTKISGEGGRASLSSVIGPNMRAVTLRVDDATGVAGFVLPSDKVDVLLTRSEQNATKHTDILLQNVKVLAIDQVAQGPGNGGGDKPQGPDKPMVAKVVTLEVTPLDAEKITLAQQIGTLSLALRNYASVHEVQAKGFSAEDLLPTPPVHPAPPPPPPTVQVPEPARVMPVTIIRGAGVPVQTQK